MKPSSSKNSAPPEAEEPPYRAGEKTWLKKHYGGEFHFLNKHGLKIHKEEDREEGRKILRALRKQLQEDREEKLQAGRDEQSQSQSTEGPRTTQKDEASRGSNFPAADNASKTEKTDEDSDDGRSLGSRDFDCNILPSGDAFNVDWVFLNTSNVHVANHRGWFKTYIPYDVTCQEGLVAIGVGSVELPVVTNNGFAILTLRNVLHAPKAICNILSLSGINRYGVTTNFRTGGKIYLDVGRKNWAILDAPEFIRLRLVGQSPKQTIFDPDGEYWLRVSLSEADLARMIHTVTIRDRIRALQNLVSESQELL
ncbi:hypothetical protein TWF281_004472 [Arthrobotrys megalospora]